MGVQFGVSVWSLSASFVDAVVAIVVDVIQRWELLSMQSWGPSTAFGTDVSPPSLPWQRLSTGHPGHRRLPLSSFLQSSAGAAPHSCDQAIGGGAVATRPPVRRHCGRVFWKRRHLSTSTASPDSKLGTSPRPNRSKGSRPAKVKLSILQASQSDLPSHDKRESVPIPRDDVERT